MNVVDTKNVLSASATVTVSWKCFLVKLYGDDSEEAELLRNFRDNVLSETPEGRGLIKLYYQLSPVIVTLMEADEEFKTDAKEMIDEILPLIGGKSK